MAINIQDITWSNYVSNIVDDNLGRLGVYIEDSSSSLTNMNSEEIILNLSLWFQTDKPVTLSSYELTINNDVKTGKPIITKEKDEYVLFYYDTIIIPRQILEQTITFSVELKIKDFISTFYIFTQKEAVALKKYLVNIYNKDGQLVEQNYKYYNMPFILKASDYILNTDLYREGFLFIYLNDKDLYTQVVSQKLEIKEYNTLELKENREYHFFPEYKELYSFITFNGNGGQSNGENTIIKLKDENFIEPVFTRLGYTFVNWYLSPSELTEELVNWATVNSDLTVYAKWQKEPYFIMYQNIEDENNKDIFDINQQPFLREAPKKTDYRFLRWRETGSSKTYMPGQLVSLTENLYVLPVWEKPTATINYYTLNGNNYELTSTSTMNLDTNKTVNEGLWSTIPFDVKPIYEGGDDLNFGDIDLYEVKVEEVIIQYYNDKYGGIQDNLTQKVNRYNNNKQITFITQDTNHYTTQDNDSTWLFFQYWTLNSKKFYPGKNYSIDTLDNVIILSAVYNKKELVEHNIYITGGEQVSLIAENFNELGSNFIKTDGAYPFFNNGQIQASGFKEEDTEQNFGIFNHINDGSVIFENFIQRENLRSTYLELVLNADNNVILSLGEDNIKDSDDDIKLSLRGSEING